MFFDKYILLQLYYTYVYMCSQLCIKKCYFLFQIHLNTYNDLKSKKFVFPFYMYANRSKKGIIHQKLYLKLLA